MTKKLTLIACLWFLGACGPESGGSSSSPSTDTISSSSTIRFLSDGETIEVIKAGGDVKSAVPGLENVCAVSLSNFTDDISYQLNDQTSLSFGPNTYTYKRPLKVSKTKAGVNDRVFSVWSSPDRVVEGVTLSFELELEPELLTFRLLCAL